MMTIYVGGGQQNLSALPEHHNEWLSNETSVEKLQLVDKNALWVDLDQVISHPMVALVIPSPFKGL